MKIRNIIYMLVVLCLGIAIFPLNHVNADNNFYCWASSYEVKTDETVWICVGGQGDGDYYVYVDDTYIGSGWLKNGYCSGVPYTPTEQGSNYIYISSDLIDEDGDLIHPDCGMYVNVVQTNSNHSSKPVDTNNQTTNKQENTEQTNNNNSQSENTVQNNTDTNQQNQTSTDINNQNNNENIKETPQLSNLEITGGKLKPAFSSDIYSYTLDVLDKTNAIHISGESLDSTNTISGTGIVSIDENTNQIEIDVTNETGTTQTYTFVLNRQEKTDFVIGYNNQQYQVMDINEKQIPEGFKIIKIVLNNVEINGLVLDENGFEDFLILNLSDEDGNTNFYIYNRNNEILTKYSDNQLTAESLKEVVGIKEVDTSKGYLIKYGIFALIIFIILLILLLILKKKKENEQQLVEQLIEVVEEEAPTPVVIPTIDFDDDFLDEKPNKVDLNQKVNQDAITYVTDKGEIFIPINKKEQEVVDKDEDGIIDDEILSQYLHD